MAATLPRLTRGFPAAVCAVSLVVVLVGLAVIATGGDLGTPTPPFVVSWRPRIDRHAWISLLAVAGAVVLVARLSARLPSGARCAIALYGLAVGLGLAVNLAHTGTRGWWAMFETGSHGSFEGHFEYLLSRPLLDHGIGFYLGHFAALLPYMTTHVKGNPPGPLILIHLLGVSDAPGLAALCVAAGALSAPAAYGLGKVLGSEERGRVAGVLSACSPAAILFGVSSFDYLFAGVGTVAAWLLVSPGRRRIAAGAAVAAVGTFLSWMLFAIPAWAAVVVLRGGGWRAALVPLVLSAAAVASLNGGLAIAYGYDPFATLSALRSAYAHGAAAGRPYGYWLLGSPAAWMVMLGLPVAWLSLRALRERDPAAIAVWLMVVAASALGVTKAETERIWLPFVPLACVAAAGALPVGRLRQVVAVLLVQSLAIELLFFTIW